MQLPLSGKLYLLKLASNHLFCPWVSIAVSGLGRLCCFHSSPWGWRNHSQTLCVGRISQPDSSSHTNWSSTNISWMEWLGCLEFQSWPSLQRLFFPHPWLSSWMFPIKTHSCQSYSKMNKSLEIAGKQRDHPLARGKAGVWSYQIWFVSRAVAATAQGSGDCCGESFFRLNCGTGAMTHWHRTSCLLCLGLSNLHRLNMGVWRGEIWMWGRRISLVKYPALSQFLLCHNISDNSIQRDIDSNRLSSLSYLYYVFFSDMYWFPFLSQN